MPRLQLKTKLVLAISGMVFALVLALSSVYVSQLLRQRINESYENAQFVAHQIYQVTKQAMQEEISPDQVNFSDPQKVHDAVGELLQSDAPVNTLLQSVIGYNPEVYDASIMDMRGVAILNTDATAIDKPVPNRPDLESLRGSGLLHQLRTVFGNAIVYDVKIPISMDGTRFGEIRVGISTLYLKNEMQPLLKRALLFSALAMLISLVLSAVLSNIALRPLAAIGKRLDAMTIEVPQEEQPEQRTDEIGAVNTKIDRLGKQIRDVKEVFSALKENLDQIMGTLQDGLILFTREGKVVLVSASAERFVGKPRGEILGNSFEQIFDDSTRLGQIVLDAFALQQGFSTRTLELDPGHRVQVSMDFISEGGRAIGVLLTMRDDEGVRRIENEIELSRRLAAIGRLTSGVAHEVKNPINSIVIHLEVLRERMLQIDPDTRRHMDIISSEIQRLDRVVKTLVDFSRPLELQLRGVDLRRIVNDVVVLARAEAEQRNVTVTLQYPEQPLLARVDDDLIKQAVLNVVLNGIQSMGEGGDLLVASYGDGERATIEIADQGMGIAPELRDKIFNLYFTTKKAGSGIGLAMTYRALQLHNGALEFESELGKGTTFRLILPLAENGTPIKTEVATGTQSAE